MSGGGRHATRREPITGPGVGFFAAALGLWLTTPAVLLSPHATDLLTRVQPFPVTTANHDPMREEPT